MFPKNYRKPIDELDFDARLKKRTFRPRFRMSAFGHKRSPAIFAPDRKRKPRRTSASHLKADTALCSARAAFGQQQSLWPTEQTGLFYCGCSFKRPMPGLTPLLLVAPDRATSQLISSKTFDVHLTTPTRTWRSGVTTRRGGAESKAKDSLDAHPADGTRRWRLRRRSRAP